MNTFSNANANAASIDIQGTLALIREFKAKGDFLDAMRDVAFEDLRASGFYIKAERDGCGEYWVIDDRIMARFNQGGQHPGPGLSPFYGVRVVPLSYWREKP